MAESQKNSEKVAIANKLLGEAAVDKAALSADAARKERAQLLQRAFTSFYKARKAFGKCDDAKEVVAIDMTLARLSLDAGDLARAEKYAGRALKSCRQHKWLSQTETIQQILADIRERATRPDQEAQMRQWARHMEKSQPKPTSSTSDADPRVWYVKRDGNFVGTAIAEINDGKLEFWQREASEIRWEMFEPCDEERREIERIFRQGDYDNKDIRIDVDELKKGN